VVDWRTSVARKSVGFLAALGENPAAAFDSVSSGERPPAISTRPALPPR
jgi:hypothetical protein